MKLVEWQDGRGYKHLSLLRDSDPDEMACEGIRFDPPNVEEIDWQQVKKGLHNLLVDHRACTWQDVQGSRDVIRGAVLGALRRPLLMLYKMKETEQREGKK